MTFEHPELHWTRLLFVIIRLEFPFRANITLCRYHLQLLPPTLRRIIVVEWTMIWYSSGRYWHCMHYAWGIFLNYYVYNYYDIYQLLRLLTVILVDSSQFCDGHDIPQLLAASTLVGISQMLINSVIYVGLDISIFLRRTWSLFSDSSHPLDVATILGLVTLAGLDYFSVTSYTPDIAVTHKLFCRIWTISYSWSS